MKNEQPRLGLWIALATLVCIFVWFGARAALSIWFSRVTGRKHKVARKLGGERGPDRDLKQRTERLESAYPEPSNRGPASGVANVD